ncbi:MAG: glycosyl hydrolase family 53 [Lachnospiraceae bacterium]|nr:glycosyl hydrolase family 53 [Lachnospiraceae bacterium]
MKRLHKKITALSLSLSLCAAVLAGCGAPKQVSTETQAEVSTQAPAPAETQEAAQTETTQEILAQVEETAGKMPAGEIYIEPVEGITDDFIRGMDASSVLVEENSGVKYYNFDGEEQDVFQTLAEGGINYIRLRVWNDPFDENGNGYGGGNNDVATAVALGKRATAYGMKVCIDFHYSDFWADPKRQHAPKAWEGMDVTQKCDALYDFTKESLTEILDAGVDVGMVQVGNEINNGMSGETKLENVTQLLHAGCRGVREISEKYQKDISIAIHYTRITDKAQVDSLVANLEKSEMDYDMIGLSFYPFWDGSMSNMQRVVELIQERYGKKVFIAETSYCYTSEDGDGSGNSLVGIDDLAEGYPATVQGQASMVRDVCAAAHEAGALGVFYWEGVWLPVGEATADNSPVWEKYGSGWASSYAADYDPEDAGLYYGGCSWDNQAMFDFEGYPLESLKVFKYLETGCAAPLKVDSVPALHVTCNVGGELILPEQVDVIYNDRSANKPSAVTWNAAQLAAIDMNAGGVYEVTGSLEDGTAVTATVEIKMDNLVRNPSFEDSDTSMWKVTYEGTDNPTDYQVNEADAHSGEVAFHFWSEDTEMDFSIEQEFTDLEAGTYQLMTYAQGGDLTEGAAMELYAVTSDGEQTEPFMVTTYKDWKNPTIPQIKVSDGSLTIGVRIRCNPLSWGTVDDFVLNRVSD